MKRTTLAVAPDLSLAGHLHQPCQLRTDRGLGPAVVRELYSRQPTHRTVVHARQLRRPKLLDLFCGAGGAASGYWRAGFEVVGMDIHDQPRYPFEFIRGDALRCSLAFLRRFDAIHASPPCQAYSTLRARHQDVEYPDFVAEVREMLTASGKPYVIENVQGAPLLEPFVLCGTMFPGLRVIRHRLFETSFLVPVPEHGKHPLVHTHDRRKRHYGKTCEWRDFVTVTGGGNCSTAAAREAMGIDWMTKKELNESIPPAYTEHVGSYVAMIV